MFIPTISFRLALILCCTLFSLLSSASDAAAQTRGRLSDGRPYRVDAEGTQLSDYIAELEVSLDDANRQLAALEDELNSKNEKIERLKKKLKGTDDSDEDLLSEGDIISNSPPSPTLSGFGNNTARNGNCEPCDKTSNLPSACNYDNPSNPLWNEVARLRAQLGLPHAATESSNSQLPPAVSELHEIKQNNSEEPNNATNPDETTSMEQIKAEDNSSRAALSLTPPEQDEVDSKPSETDAQLSQRMKAELIKINNLIGKRKTLLDAHNSAGSKKGLTVQPKELRTKDGTSLDTLRYRIKSGELSEQISSQLQEIESLLNDDIGLLERISRLY